MVAKPCAARGQKWSLIQCVEFLIIAVTENFIIFFYLFDFKLFFIMRIAGYENQHFVIAEN
jgi:hypothetical protein